MVSHSDSRSGEMTPYTGPPAGGPLVPAGNGHLWPAEPTARPEILSVHPRPIDLINALRRRWGWALGLGLLAAGLAVGIAWLLIPVNYTATAWLRIAEKPPHLLFKAGGFDDFLNDKRAAATLITSNFVLNAAMRKPGVGQLPAVRDERDPVTWMKRNVKVSFPGNSEILQIAMTGEDPMQLVTMVNAVMNAYMEEVVAVDREESLRRKRLLDQSYQRNMEQIKKKQYLYNELANQIGSSDSEEVRMAKIHRLEDIADLRRQVNRLRQEIAGLERQNKILAARLDMFGEDEKEEPDENELIARMVEMAVQQDQIIVRKIQEINELQTLAIEQSMVAAGGENSPAVMRIQEQIKSREEMIAKRREQIVPQYVELARAQIAQGVAVTPLSPADKLRDAIAETEMKKSVLENELKEAMIQFKEAAEEKEKLGAYSYELESRKVELERLKKITNHMGNELEEREIELAAPERVKVLEKANVPRSNDVDKKIQRVTFIGLAAFALAVMGVAAVDFLSRRVSSPTEVSYGLGVQVMGDLPLVSGRNARGRRRATGMATGPMHGMLIESIDNIRTALLHRADAESLRSVMVTSALEKEGKTTLTSQLAASLARSGRRTLLLDGDLRRPSQHRLFELPVEPGMSEVLRGELDMDEVIRPTRVPGLWLAPGGRCDLDAIQSLAQGGLHEAYDKLKEEFDFIIIDSGPVLTHADALLFGRYADAVILSVLRDVSRVPRVFEACERLRAVDIRLLGAVINGASFGKYRSYYHYRPYTIEVETASA